MAPRDFSELNTAGAGNSLDTAPLPGMGADKPWGSTLAPGESSMNGNHRYTNRSGEGNPGQDGFGPLDAGDWDPSTYNPQGGDGGSSGYGNPKPSTPPSAGRQPIDAQMSTDLGRQDTTGITPWGQQFLQNTGGSQMRFGGFYAEGGAIPEEDEDPNQMAQGPANGLMAMIQKASASVQEVLSYGRQKHGLGNSNEGAIQEAERMPSVPGTPSNSGVKPVQPMPGPLPPTSNPFGKRAGAEPQDDGAGAIDETDEETA